MRSIAWLSPPPRSRQAAHGLFLTLLWGLATLTLALLLGGCVIVRQEPPSPQLPSEYEYFQSGGKDHSKMGIRCWSQHGVPGVISRKFSVREIATKSLLAARNDYTCKNNTFCYTLLHTPREM